MCVLASLLRGVHVHTNRWCKATMTKRPPLQIVLLLLLPLLSLLTPLQRSYNVDVCQSTFGNASLPLHKRTLMHSHRYACAHSARKSQQFSSCARVHMVCVKPQARIQNLHAWPRHASSWHTAAAAAPRVAFGCRKPLSCFMPCCKFISFIVPHSAPSPLFCTYEHQQHAVIERIYLFCMCECHTLRNPLALQHCFAALCKRTPLLLLHCPLFWLMTLVMATHIVYGNTFFAFDFVASTNDT